MPAYILATVDITDEALYMEQYVPPVRKTIADHGGTILAVMSTEMLEGKRFRSHNVVLHFPDMAAALGWYRSPEYQEILPLRLASTTGSVIAVEGIDETPTPGSAYIIATMEVLDPDTYSTKYGPAAIASVVAQGGKALVRGGATEFLEGDAYGTRTVMIEWPGMDAALAWYHSPEYQEVVPIRQAATDGGMIATGGLPG